MVEIFYEFNILKKVPSVGGIKLSHIDQTDN